MRLDVLVSSLPPLLQGAVLTIALLAAALVLGMALALPAALASLSRHVWLHLPARAYIFVFRGTPLLVQIFLIYYGLAQFDWVRDSLLWPWLREAAVCAVLAFGLNTGAYTAEILRGAMRQVPRGELEAAQALGLPRWQRLWLIWLPRAWHRALPAYSNEVILMLKGTALASTITLLDLTGMARTIIARTYTPIEVFLLAGLLYLLIALILQWGFRRLERRVMRFQQRQAV